MPVINEFFLKNRFEEQLYSKLILPTTATSNCPVVFMMTGDGKSGSNGLSWINLPNQLVDIGVASYIFDFSGLGKSQGERRKLTLSKALHECGVAFNHLLTLDVINKNKVNILGASFGGNVAVLFASENSVNTLILKSPVSFYPDSFLLEFGQDIIDQWSENGYSEQIDFEYAFYLDALMHNTYGKARNILCPCLITHGTADEIVPFSQSKHLLKSLCNSAEPILIDFQGVNHRYSNEGAWDKMAKVYVEYIKKRNF